MENTENKMEDIYVGLNVGGTIYKTSRNTLVSAPDSFFSTLLSGDVPSKKDEQGNYMIDRDGEIFRHILNFLRNGTLLLPRGFKDVALLECEADFFMLESLKKVLPIGINCTGAIFQIPRSDFDREPSSFLRDILSGQRVTPMDADGNVLLDIPQSHFKYLREYLKPGNYGGWSMVGDSDTFPSLWKAADFFGLEILQAYARSVICMQRNASDRRLTLFFNSSEDVYTIYCTESGRIFSGALSSLRFRHIEGGPVRCLNFSLNKDRAGTDIQHLTAQHPSNGIPANWEEMVESISRSLKMPHCISDVCAGCKRADFVVSP